MKTAFIFLSLVLLSFLANGQDVQIIHYQKTAEINQLILPNEMFQSKYFDIKVEDSVYNSGKISIKKGSIDSIKYKYLNIEFSQDTISNVNFVVKGKKNANLLLKRLNIRAIEPGGFSNNCFTIDNKPYQVKILVVRGKLTIRISSPKC